MEQFLSVLYLVLLLAGDVLLVALLVRSFGSSPARQREELEDWLDQRLAAQSEEYDRRLRASQAALADQTYTAVRGVGETLQP